jgi:hypothetical protein
MVEFVPKKQYEQIKVSLRQGAQRTSPPVGGRFEDFLSAGIYHFTAGAQDFTTWSRKMQEDFGGAIRPHFQEIWLAMPFEARKIADRLKAQILRKVEIAEVESVMGLFAKVNVVSLGNHSLSSSQRVRLAAQLPLSEVVRMLAESDCTPSRQESSQPIQREKAEPEMPALPIRKDAALHKGEGELSEIDTDRFPCAECGKQTEGTLSPNGVTTTLCPACYRSYHPAGSQQPRNATWIDYAKRTGFYVVAIAVVLLAGGLSAVLSGSFFDLWTARQLKQFMEGGLGLALWVGSLALLKRWFERGCERFAIYDGVRGLRRNKF